MKVSSTMLLKTNSEKMSVCGLAMILLKTNKLLLACHDVDENKGSYRAVLVENLENSSS